MAACFCLCCWMDGLTLERYAKSQHGANVDDQEQEAIVQRSIFHFACGFVEVLGQKSYVLFRLLAKEFACTT